MQNAENVENAILAEVSRKLLLIVAATRAVVYVYTCYVYVYSTYKPSSNLRDNKTPIQRTINEWPHFRHASKAASPLAVLLFSRAKASRTENIDKHI